jgi:hypothetical protein
MGVDASTVERLGANPGADARELAQTIFKDFEMNRPPKMDVWKPFVQRAKESEARALGFFHLMHETLAVRVEPGVTGLKQAAQDATPGDPRLATAVHVSYMCGYPDAHGALAIVPWFDPMVSLDRSGTPPPSPPPDPSPDEFLKRIEKDRDLREVITTAKDLPQQLAKKTQGERAEILRKRLWTITKALYDVDLSRLPTYFTVPVRSTAAAVAGIATAVGVSLVPSVLPAAADWPSALTPGLSLWGAIKGGWYMAGDRILACLGPMLYRQQALGWHAGEFFRYGEYEIEHLTPGYGRQRQRPI